MVWKNLTFLLNYRNTPIVGLGMSPFELLIFRKVKDKLPTTDELLKPNMYNIDEVQKKLKQMRTKNKLYYDKDTQSLPDCNLGDDV